VGHFLYHFWDFLLANDKILVRIVEKNIKILRDMEIWLWKNRIDLSTFIQAKIREEMEKDRSKKNMRRAKTKQRSEVFETSLIRRPEDPDLSPEKRSIPLHQIQLYELVHVF